MTGFWSHRKTARLRTLLGDDALWIVPKIWSYAAENQPDGDLSGYTSDELAMLIGCPKHAASMLQALQSSGFVDSDGKIHDWEHHNGYHESYSKRAKDAANARWAKEREKKEKNQKKEEELKKEESGNRKVETSNASRMLVASDSTETSSVSNPATKTPSEPQKTQGDGNASEIKPSRKRSTPMPIPTIEELKLHAAKIGLPETEAYKFHGYYESNGWRVGKNPMKSWVGAIANWKGNYDERRTNTTSGPNSRGPGAHGNPRNAGIAGFDEWNRDFQARAVGDGQHGPWDDFGRKPAVEGEDSEAGRITPSADCKTRESGGVAN